MENVIADLLGRYERKHIGRRQLIQSLALLVSASSTATASGFRGKGIDHVSLTVSDPRRTAEFYKKTFGYVELPQYSPASREIRLGQAADDRAVIAVRSGPATGVIDHFGIGLEPYDLKALAQELKDIGVIEQGPTLSFRDPDGIRVQLLKSDPR